MSLPSSPDFDPVVRALARDEEVIWAGKPDFNRVFHDRVPFAPFWGAMTVGMVWMLWKAATTVLSSTDHRPGSPIGVVIGYIALGVSAVIPLGYGTLSPWIVRKRAQVTFYALTNKRAIIIVANNRVQRESVWPQEFRVWLRKLEGNNGDLVIKRVLRGSKRKPTIEETILLCVDNAQQVEQLFIEQAATVGHDARFTPHQRFSPRPSSF